MTTPGPWLLHGTDRSQTAHAAHMNEAYCKSLDHFLTWHSWALLAIFRVADTHTKKSTSSQSTIDTNRRFRRSHYFS